MKVFYRAFIKIKRLNNMAIQNCLGLNASKLKEAIKDMAENVILDEVLYNTFFNSDGVVKTDCEILCKNSVLPNFNEFLLNSVKNEFDKINAADRANGSYDVSNLGESLKNDVLRNMKKFNTMMKNGQGDELKALNAKYNRNGSLFPDNLDSTTKDKLLKLLDDSNYFSGNDDNAMLFNNRNNSIVIDSNDTVLANAYDDDLFSNIRPLKSIPTDELDALKLKKLSFKCFREKFRIENYIINSDKGVIVTPDKLANLKKIHSEILTPIYNFYYGKIDDSQCNLKIYYGLLSMEGVRQSASGSFVSKHLTGEAVDFSLMGISNSKIVSDISKGLIDIDFGVLMITNGVHISLPYTINDYLIKNVIVESKNNSADSIEINIL